MSFLEIMIVVVIMAAIAALAGPPIFRQFAGSKVSLAKVQMQNLVQGLLTYSADNNTFPSNDQGLKALFEKPVLGEIPANWNGPYLQGSLPKDPWDKDYLYQGSKNEFTLSSYGESGTAEGGTGIVCNQNGCK